MTKHCPARYINRNISESGNTVKLKRLIYKPDENGTKHSFTATQIPLGNFLSPTEPWFMTQELCTADVTQII